HGIVLGSDGSLWQLSLGGTSTWSAVSIAGTPPAPRRSALITYDPTGNRVLVLGGIYIAPSPGDSTSSELWALSLDPPATWQKLSPGGTIPVLVAGAAACDTLRRHVVHTDCCLNNIAGAGPVS